jgi:myo-inositol-1(or 4)-monophosphatase
MEFAPYKQVAITAAYQAAEKVRSKFGSISRVRKKDAVEIVTEADTDSENEIISVIRARYPEHAILSEESGLTDTGGDFRWIIDPLDGTVNFAHQVPIFCISIALTYGDDILLGVVLNPLDGELYTALSGQGAYLNNHPIQVSSVSEISESLLVSGFPYHMDEEFESITARWNSCLRASQAVRRLGSAALDICYVACGRFEAFWEQLLKPWDTAAGALIAAEAGASVTTFAGRPFKLDDREILVANGHIHKEMIELLKL